jgi:hypothetical protein
MKMVYLLLISMVTVLTLNGQNDEALIIRKLKNFHASLNDPASISSFVHDSVSYGHSNGWIQTREDLEKDAGKKILYHSFREDSIKVVVSGNVAYARFVADIDVTLNDKRANFHLKVLEVWIRELGNWKLFARNAAR